MAASEMSASKCVGVDGFPEEESRTHPFSNYFVTDFSFNVWYLVTCIFSY